MANHPKKPTKAALAKVAALEFEDIQPTSRVGAGADTLSVTNYGLGFSSAAAVRLGLKPGEAVGLQGSKDGRAIKFVRPGAFRLTARDRKETGENMRFYVNSIAIPQKFASGKYFYEADDVYMKGAPDA